MRWRMEPALRFSTASGLTMQRVRSTGMCSFLWKVTSALLREIVGWRKTTRPNSCEAWGLSDLRHHARQGARHGARVRGHARSGRFEGSDLLRCRPLPARDDGPGVAHALAGRGGRAGDEGRHGLVHLLSDELRRALLGAAA